MLVQTNSPQVHEDGIGGGDIILNASNKVLAKKGGFLEVIPLFCIKKWRTESRTLGSSEMHTWVSTELYTPRNADALHVWEGEGKDKGYEFRRVMVHEWVCLVAEDIAKDIKARRQIAAGELPDLDDALLPTMISFKRSSMSASKELFKFQAKAESFNLPISMQVFELGMKLDKTEKFSYYVTTIEKGRKSTAEELAVCKSWHGILYTQPYEQSFDVHEDETPKAVVADATRQSAARHTEQQRGQKAFPREDDIPTPEAAGFENINSDEIPF